MGTTISRLLNTPIMQKHACVLTDAGLCNNVQYVTVMEAPDFRFSNLGEDVFILTTLSAHHGSLDDINLTITGLCEAKVSAIGIKLGRFVHEIHESTIAIARAYQVPLITFDSSVYFREILSETLSIITGNQHLLSNRLNEVNRNLTDAILQDYSISEFLNIFSQQINCYCCCVDVFGKKLAEKSTFDGPLDTQIVFDIINQFFYHFPNGDGRPYQQDGIIVFPCIARQQLLAAVCIVTSELHTDFLMPLVQSIVNAISIKIMEMNLKLQAERELYASILDDILFSQKSTPSSIIERLELLNFMPRLNNLIILLSRTDTNYRESNFGFTTESLQQVFSKEFESSIVFRRGNEYIALVSYDLPKNTTALKRTLFYCSSAITSTGIGHFNLGCSIPTSNFSSISSCYVQAKKAIQFGLMMNPHQQTYLYDTYLELGLISCGMGSSEADIFFQRIIVPIQEYDKQYKTTLWETLEASFLHDRLEQVAVSLHVHISTLRYRLQKIETITGYNYFTIHDRLTLYLAYLLRCVSTEKQLPKNLK